MLIKKSPSLPRNLAYGTFGKLPIVFSTKADLLYLLYSRARRCCLLHLIKQNCLLKTFAKTLILMTPYLPVFPSRTNLKLHSISVTPKMVKKVITNLHMSKASGPDCIQVHSTRAVALDIPKAFGGFGMLAFFTNLSLMEFQARYLALFLLFSVIDSLEWFWMGNLHKNIQLMLEFLKVHSWSYTFPTIH